MVALILSAASLSLCVAGFFFFRRYIDKKTAARELLADYRTETYRLIAEIDAAADRDSLLVEERIKTLKKLLDDTDRRISVYMRELQRSRAGEAMYTSLGRGIRAALDSAPLKNLSPMETDSSKALAVSAVPSEQQKLQQQLPQQPELQLQPETQETPVPKETPPRETRNRKTKRTKIKTQIAEMSAKGLSPAEIASKLNLSMGEVELAINLIQK